MDREILEWISKEPQDWWQKTQSSVYTWGKGSWNQLGTSTRENSSPALAEEWKDVQQVNNFFMGVDCNFTEKCPLFCYSVNLRLSAVSADFNFVVYPNDVSNELQTPM